MTARTRAGIRRWLIVITCAYVVALVGPALLPWDPASQAFAAALPPSWPHLLGTDSLGRDLLTRVLVGARVSLLLALLATLVALTIGSAVGAVAGWVGGWLDDALMRLVDAGLAIPRIFFVLVTLALWEHANWMALVAILGVTGWFDLSRLVRAEVQGMRRRVFVTAARGLGLGDARILARHVLPNVFGPISVQAALGIAQVVLIEAGLSYLGIGVPAPMPSWGNIIAEGQPYLPTAPWIAIVPGLCLVATVLAFARLGDHLHAAVNPATR